MKKIKLDPTVEKTILIGVIVSNKLIRKLSNVYKPDFIESEYIRIVANWCFDFYEKYGNAPKKHIKDIYKQQKKKKRVHEDMMDNIAKVLQLASKQFKRGDKYNYQYVLDLAVEYFKKQSLKKFSCDIDSMLDDGNLKDCEAMVARFSLGSIDSSRAINPFTDKDNIRKAFTEDRKPIFKMPGILGKMINDDLCRESFIGIMGQEKIGKTWNLLEFCIQAARQRCNVAFFQAGDMTEAQQLRRIHIRIAKKSDKKKYCGVIYVPVLDCFYNQINSCDYEWRVGDVGLIKYLKLRKHERGKKDFLQAVAQGDRFLRAFKRSCKDYLPCTKCIKKKQFSFNGSLWYKKIVIDKPLSWQEAVKSGEQFQKRMGKKNFRMLTYSNDTLTVREISNRLDILEKEEGFIADVVGVDYPDIMAAEDGRQETRHQENAKWKGLRRISQDRKCCLIAPTQADAAAYGQDSLNPQNFSEDKRKYSHVTSMLALNQTGLEKRLGLMRVGQLFVRDDEFSLDKQVVVLQCLKIGRPYLASYYHYY